MCEEIYCAKHHRERKIREKNYRSPLQGDS